MSKSDENGKLTFPRKLTSHKHKKEKKKSYIIKW
jgi:hypothetical protein